MVQFVKTHLDPAIAAYYSDGHERVRVFPRGEPSLEYVRKTELFRRLLPPPPCTLLDVGGGPGVYAVPLTEAGYRVLLLDPVPLHIEQATQAGISAALGDARALPAGDQTQDAVVLCGPLYHLTQAADRQAALAEARRVLRPGGTLIATAISRYGSLLYGLFAAQLDDPLVRQVAERDLASGQHRNPVPADRRFFTTAYFHAPAEFAAEISAAGFTGVTVYGVEGPGWPLWVNEPLREQVLTAARLAERAAVELSPNFLAAGRRPPE